MRIKLLFPIMAALIAIVVLGCPNPLAPPTAKEVTISAIPGVNAPVSGATPVTGIIETAQYTGTVSWSPAVSETFAAETEYTATITLTAKAGFTLSGVAANSFTVAGATSVSHGANSGVVTVVFPATAAPGTINLLAIPGVTVPAAGVAPVTTITETAQYTGTVSWSPEVSGTFAADTAYTATITLTPKTGFTLSGVVEDSFTVAGATSVGNSADSGEVTAEFPVTEATVDMFAIPGVTAPELGAAPVSTIAETAQYTGVISWSPEVSGTFAAETAYTATISLTAKAGFTLIEIMENSFTVAGATSVSHSSNSGVVTAVFPVTAATVSLLGIPGVTAPELGAAPVTTITGTDQYTGMVSWSPEVSGTFTGSTVYTATITLTASTGFTLSGVATNSFTVAGATSVSHSADSGVVTAVFPATAAATINLLAIPGVAAPVLGATPVTTITETPQYTGTVSWSPAVSGTFAVGTVYTATITLTAKPGFTLSGVATNSFTVAGATSVSHSADSGVVAAEFPVTAATVSMLALAGVTAPVTGVAPVTAVTETDQYTGTVSWSPAVSGTFAASTVYTATITLTAKAGFTLSGVAANAFTVAGATSVSHSAGSGVVTAEFPTTAVTVSMLAIPGVTAPTAGISPVTAVTETDQYTGSVSWSPAVSSTFASSTVYTATITLTAKAGFTLSGVAANAFTVAGATNVSHSAGSGVVTAEFPTTAVTVSMLAIPGVTAPVTGATRVTSITATDQYTGTISWSPLHSTFAGSTVYTATITLTAKTGFTLSGVAANSFTVAGADSVSHSANSGVVTVVFPITEPATITLFAIGGVRSVYGVTPATTVTETAQYTGTVSWTPAHSAFAVGTQYTATITLTAKPGFTLSGVAANSFTLTGATSLTHTAGSGVVTAVFPVIALPAVGDTGPAGGKVFYDKGNTTGGWRFLEAATTDLAIVNPQWKTTQTLTSGTATGIGTGYANTYTALAGTTHPAAEQARNAIRGGFNDWFLPSKDELNLMNQQKTMIGGFYNSGYWSSSEVDAANAWAQWFGTTNNTQLTTSKTATLDRRVRVIRRF